MQLYNGQSRQKELGQVLYMTSLISVKTTSHNITNVMKKLNI